MATNDKSSSRRSWMSLQRKEKPKDKEPQLYRSSSSGSGRRPSFTLNSRSSSSQTLDSTFSTTPVEADFGFNVVQPSPPTPHRSSSSNSFETQEPDSADVAHHQLERTASAPLQSSKQSSKNAVSSGLDLNLSGTLSRAANAGTFTKSLASVLTLGLVRDRSDDAERGRPVSQSFSRPDSERSQSRGRSTSPFHLRTRSRNRRDPSVGSEVGALSLDADSDSESAPRVRPRNAFSVGDDSDEDDSEDSEESWSEPDGIDELTAQHTEQNATVPTPNELMVADGDIIEPDPLGEGVNVVIPSEPYFPSTQFSPTSVTTPSSRFPRRRKSTKVERDLLPMTTSRPSFQRNRCTITMVHGDPKKAAEESGRVPRTYLVASDLSEESRYAVEWGIGTVLRDGDTMTIVNVNESESRLDPPEGAGVDRLVKLRSQQDRQTLAYLLVRQATGLLQRTKLHVTVICQAWHAKNARRMLMDIIDYKSPTMVIVGSRGLTRLKGILLGSTSHYLIQKSPVPVMVARRRLKRPAKKVAHLSPHRARVSLAEAAIDKVGPGRVDKDVEVLRDELQRDDAAREAVDLRLAGTDRGLAEEDEDEQEILTSA